MKYLLIFFSGLLQLLELIVPVVSPKGLATQDAFASCHETNPFHQFVKLGDFAWFRPHWMRDGSDTVSTSL